MSKSIKIFLSLFLLSSFIISCNVNEETTEVKTEPINPNYSIGSPEYEDIAKKALDHVSAFEFVEFGEMVSDDIEYYLPDGGEETRTSFIGKEDFMNFWNTYQEKTGLSSWDVSNVVAIPIVLHDKLAYTNVDGTIVTTYFTLDPTFGEQKTSIRANWAFHFNEDKKIDKIYSYYDRTPLIEAAKLNVLK